MDVLLTLTLALLTSLVLLHRHESSALSWILNFALVLPLAVRRRWPSAVFGVIAAAALVQWAHDDRLGADVALLIALYTVAAYQPRRHALVAAAVLEAGIILAAARFAPAGGGVLGSIVFLSGLLTAALFLGTTVRTRRVYLESLVDRARRLERERDSQARLAVIAERTRIAREMHDIVAHSLSVMISLADGAALTTGTDPDTARRAMQGVSSTGRSALAEMRRLLGVLRDDDAPAGAQRAPQPGLLQLEELMASVRDAGLPVRFTITGAPRPLPMTRQTAIYRIAQEALTNVLKHGKEVESVQVTLAWSADGVDLDVRDDGARRLAGPPDVGAGHGLNGMRERVTVHGGSVTAGPGPGRGWQVHARLPVDTAEAEPGPPADLGRLSPDEEAVP